MACQMGCPTARRLARQQQHSMQSGGSALPGSRGPGRPLQQKAALSEGRRLQAPEKNQCAYTASRPEHPDTCRNNCVLMDAHAVTMCPSN